MHINLVCEKCNASSRVSFATLYDAWKVGYDEMDPERKKIARVGTNVKCHCGHKARCDGPMFHYVFQLIFDEFVKVKEV